MFLRDWETFYSQICGLFWFFIALFSTRGKIFLFKTVFLFAFSKVCFWAHFTSTPAKKI